MRISVHNGLVLKKRSKTTQSKSAKVNKHQARVEKAQFLTNTAPKLLKKDETATGRG